MSLRNAPRPAGTKTLWWAFEPTVSPSGRAQRGRPGRRRLNDAASARRSKPAPILARDVGVAGRGPRPRPTPRYAPRGDARADVPRAVPPPPHPPHRRSTTMKLVILAASLLAALIPVASAQAAPTTGMLLTQSQIDALPASGTAFNSIASKAKGSWPAPKISDQENQNDTYALAGALYYAKTGDKAIRTKVRNAIVSAKGTEKGGRVLALARNLQSYVLAADLIDLRSLSASDDASFRSWLSSVRRASMTECSNLIACNESRPNNWGTHSGAARVAADRSE